ncbi:amino acid permease [Streptomyces sp. SID3343]|uniref:amino acid permease n=1 Tax=Streptomyces sp. SID3343 TaxID=2690260 RepID=UPI0013716B63|nr:amino acid permease [Streptomyces sp. SID3343]MYW01208.1 amino acid permease [Streptomyces sp. SID3343]
MSHAAAPQTPAPPQDPASASADHPEGTLGLSQATALVVGGVVGTGIFLLPATLAKYGTISILAFALVTVGALAIAVIFGKLGARIPAAGGPYAYAREAFGEFPGFLNAWSFWITAWAGNAGIAVAWVGYVNYFLHWDSTPGRIAIALVGLWVPALINLSGVKNMGAFQLVTTILKFVPLMFVAIVGLFFIEKANFGPFNASGDSFLGALQVSAALVVFAYSGIEGAAVASEKVKDPERNVGRASIYGTLACAAVYMLSTIAVMGNVAHGELVDSSAPFSDALNNMFGGGVWGGIMAAMAIVSGIGALNGWTMLCAEMPYAAAKDGMFPKPFATVSKAGVPGFGILVATILTSVVVAVNYVWSEDAFETILLLATVTTVVPYMFSASAQLFWLVTRERPVSRAALAKDVTIAIVGFLFTLWMVYGAGSDAVLKSLIMLLLGIPVYIWVKASRGEYGPGGKEATYVEDVTIDMRT